MCGQDASTCLGCHQHSRTSLYQCSSIFYVYGRRCPGACPGAGSLRLFSKFGRQKLKTQPWWPLLRYYYYAAACDTDIPGDQHHRQWSYYAILVDDLLLPSCLAHNATSNTSTRRWNKNILLSLGALYHHNNTIAMALPSPPLNDIYVYSPRVYVFGQYGAWCLQ